MENNKRFIDINSCNHYFLNESGSEQMFYLDSLFFVEEDTDTKHPLGTVYKPKHCLDTLIRFVRQPNHSFFMFNLKDWNNKDNLYAKKFISAIVVKAIFGVRTMGFIITMFVRLAETKQNQKNPI